MKIFRTILKIFLWFIVSIVGLLLLVSVLVYTPPVQNFIKDKAAAAVSESLGMDLSIGRIRLRFPIRLSVDNTTLITTGGDTLTRVGHLGVGVAVGPLFHGEVLVPRLEITDVGANYRDTVSNTHLAGTVGSLVVENASARLFKKSVDIGNIQLDRTDISLDLGESRTVPDTTAADTTSSFAWTVGLRRLGIDGLAFRMRTSPEITELETAIGKIRLRDLEADLGSQEVNLGSLRIDDGAYTYLTDTVTVAVTEEAVPSGSLPAKTETAGESLPWTVRLGRFELRDNSARYGTLYGEPADGLDPSHIEIDALNLWIDSVYNRGTDIAATIGSLTLHERSGLEITEGKGRFSTDSAAIVLDNLELRTAASRIRITANAGASLSDMEASAPLSAKISADIGMSDVLLAYPDEVMQKALGGKSLVFNTDISGTLGNISVRTVHAQMPGHIDLEANGNLRGMPDTEQLSGNISLGGSFTDLGFIKEFLPDSSRNSIGFPENMTLAGTAAATGSAYAVDLGFTADSGRIDIKGNFDTESEIYDADIAVADFPLGTFLPQDSLGIASLTLSAKGSGLDPVADGTTADISANISAFEYNGYDFAGISLDASLNEHLLNGNISSTGTGLQLRLGIDGELRDSLYAVNLKGPVSKVDMRAMGFSNEPLGISLFLDAHATARMADTLYHANIAMDTVRFTHGARTERSGLITISADAAGNSVKAGLTAGDLRLDFVSPESPSSLAEGFVGVTDVLLAQIDSLDVDMRPVQQTLPEFKLDISAGRNNPLREYLRSTGTDFNKISLSAGNGPDSPIRAGAIVEGLRTGGMTLDTLNVWMRQRDEKLAYAVRLRNRPGNLNKMALIVVAGDVAGNTVKTNVMQRDRADNTGFRFGITTELLDRAVRATMTPQNPVFAYRNWSVNDGNYLTYHFDKRIEADMRIEGANDSQFFRITSSDREDMPPGSIQLDIAGIELAELFAFIPSPPPVEGTFSGNGVVGLSDPIIKGDLTLGIQNLRYNNQRVGDISLGAMANTDTDNIWQLGMNMAANGSTVITATGSHDAMDTGTLDMKITVPGLPLELANPFLPADMARVKGEMYGDLAITGTAGHLKMDGGVNFKDTKLTVPMIGTTYGLSEDRITIGDGKVVFKDFGLIAPNKQKLSLDGNIDIKDLSAIRADLRLFASDFEAVDSPRSGGSQVYGKAALDIDMTLRGLLDALVIRGNINILSRTNIHYTLRDSPFEVENIKQDIVTFVSFADQETWAESDSTTLRRQSGVDVLVNIDIQEEVEAIVNLVESGNSRIELEGDGALTFMMNNQGDTRLSGRYTLSGGIVVYSLPIIPEKAFSIDDGSYVEWVGDLTKPSFNITATEVAHVKVVDKDKTSRTVKFNVSIIVSNSLEDMAITFDLAAPGDAAIQNALQMQTPEQRSTEAIYMLITNTYLGEGGGQSNLGDVNQQIGDFVSRELNQWARNNLKGVELSVGIDSVDDNDGTSHYDYSYSVSKSLFEDRVKVTIGGSVSEDPSAGNMSENLVDDVSIEYRLAKRDNMFLKVYRYNTQESILEGEVTETGLGFVLRKKMNRLRELFRLTPDPEKRRERQKAREEQRRIREELRRAEEENIRQEDGGSDRQPENDGQVPTAPGEAAISTTVKEDE